MQVALDANKSPMQAELDIPEDLNGLQSASIVQDVTQHVENLEEELLQEIPFSSEVEEGDSAPTFPSFRQQLLVQ